MTDTGPTTTTLDQETPIQRERDEILQARREVTVSGGTLSPVNLAQMLEVGQTMAKAGSAIPPHLRGSPGACLAVIEYAHHWGLLAYGVANKSYVVNDRLCFESQLIHAVIELHAPLHKDNLNFSFEGEGPKRKCKIWAQCMIRGEVKTLTWESPEFAKIQPKKSPLWETKPDLQFYYNTSRDWARVFFPHILLGALTDDEAAGIESDDARAAKAKDVTPENRFVGNGGIGEGFRADNVERGLSGSPMGSEDELANLASEAEVQKASHAPTEPTGKISAESTEDPSGKLRKPRKPRGQQEQPNSAAETNASTVPPNDPPSGVVTPGGSTPSEAVSPTSDRPGAEQKDGPDGGPSSSVAGLKRPATASGEGVVQHQTGQSIPRATEPDKTQPPPDPAKPEGGDVDNLKTPEDYIEYAKGWMRLCTSVEDLMARWRAEGGHRGRCMVVGDHFGEIKSFRDVCIETLEGK